MVAESHLIDRSRVEKVKRNLFGTPTEDEKKLFHSEYEKTINEERKVMQSCFMVRDLEMSLLVGYYAYGIITCIFTCSFFFILKIPRALR